jgi:hypothetical protein
MLFFPGRDLEVIRYFCFCHSIPVVSSVGL